METEERFLTELARLAEEGCFFGEVFFTRTADGYEVRHYLDDVPADRELFTEPEAAIEIAKYDAAGNYRALKSAPTLRRGWELWLPDAASLRLALDFLYPAMPGTWLAREMGKSRPVNLRQTLDRQTGMYRIAAKISDAQADVLIGEVCPSRGKCLKTILWRIDADTPIRSLPPGKFDPGGDLLDRGGAFIPLLCEEPCNILVAAAREVVKTSVSPPPAA